jgi:hypothetical protein
LNTKLLFSLVTAFLSHDLEKILKKMEKSHMPVDFTLTIELWIAFWMAYLHSANIIHPGIAGVSLFMASNMDGEEDGCIRKIVALLQTTFRTE